MKPARAGLHVVEPEPEYAGDIYAEARAAANDRDRWRQMHERGERREAIFIADRPRCHVLGFLKVSREP